LPKLPSGGLGLDLADVGRGRAGDRDPARLHRLRDFADQLDLQQSVVKRRALDLDIVGQIELTLERPRRDAPIEEFALRFFGLAAFDAAVVTSCPSLRAIPGAKRQVLIDDILEALSSLDHSPRNPPGGKPVRLKSTHRTSLAA
jgi:hypothetical protein